MRSRRFIVLCLWSFLLVFLSSCQHPQTKILIGGTARVSRDGPDISDSVLVISGGKLRFVGLRKDAAITQDSERTDLRGKWIVPADTAGRLEGNAPADLLILNSPDRANVARRMVNGEWQ